jgi:hypothetical protein
MILPKTVTNCALRFTKPSDANQFVKVTLRANKPCPIKLFKLSATGLHYVIRFTDNSGIPKSRNLFSKPYKAA